MLLYILHIWQIYTFSGITVQFSQEEYIFDESAGIVTLKVIIKSSSKRMHPISFKYRVFVSDKFAPNPGLYWLYPHLQVSGAACLI